MADVEMRGMEDILKKLKSFPFKFQKNVIKGAIRASAAAISKEAKLNAPEDEGELIKSIGVIQRKTKDRTIIKFSVAPLSKKFHKLQDANGEKHYNYGGLIEFGNSHMAAQPYLRPAYENKGTEAIDIAKEYMSKRIDNEVAKL